MRKEQHKRVTEGNVRDRTAKGKYKQRTRIQDRLNNINKKRNRKC